MFCQTNRLDAWLRQGWQHVDSDGALSLQVSTVAGATCVLEMTPSLLQPSWVAVDQRNGDGGHVTLTHASGSGKLVF